MLLLMALFSLALTGVVLYFIFKNDFFQKLDDMKCSKLGMIEIPTKISYYQSPSMADALALWRHVPWLHGFNTQSIFKKLKSCYDSGYRIPNYV